MDEPVLKYCENEHNFNIRTCYYDTKLLVAMFVHAMTSCVRGEEVVISNFRPGMVTTSIEGEVAGERGWDGSLCQDGG